MTNIKRRPAGRRCSIFGQIACVVLAACSSTSWAELTPPQPRKEITELQHKGFRISTIANRTSMEVIPNYVFDPLKEPWEESDHKNCVNSTARLAQTSAAAIVSGTNRVLAFLDCPAGNDADAMYVVAQFDAANTDSPLCFSRIHLMKNPGYFFWGGVESVHARAQPDGSLFVAAGLAGADAGDFWSSSALLYVDADCKLTLLTQLYANGRADDDGICEGHYLVHSFVGASKVKLQRKNVRCKKGTRVQNPSTARASTRVVDLRALLQNEKLRSYQP